MTDEEKLTKEEEIVSDELSQSEEPVETEEMELTSSDELSAVADESATADESVEAEESAEAQVGESADDVKAALRELRTATMRAAPEGAPDLTEAPDDRAWYVVHCYSGYENKVRHNLEQRIESMGMSNQIFQVIVPTEEEIEVKEGKRRTVERRVFPGYILVQMVMNDDSWYVVRNTPGVTGFVGMGNKPTPLRTEEVTSILKRMEAEAPKVKVTFKPGQKVRIVDGPFNDFMGTVDEINMDKAKVRVLVSFFGRETPVELDFLQVEKM
jgi:transcriptional antiterminator NusG